MIGAAIGAAVGLGSAIFGGIKSASAARKARAAQRRQEAQNTNWYLRRYNEDATQTAEGQAMLRKSREYAEDLYNKAAGASKVAGATDESAAMAKHAGNETVANTMGNVAASGTARKDNIEQTYMGLSNQLAQQRIATYQQSAQDAATAGSQGMQAGMSLVAADLSSHLNNGKGTMESAFAKSGGTSAGTTTGGTTSTSVPRTTTTTGGTIKVPYAAPKQTAKYHSLW